MRPHRHGIDQAVRAAGRRRVMSGAGQQYADNWAWYVPGDARGHAEAVSASMPKALGLARRVLIKGGGDGGNVWSQWGGDNLVPYEDEGLEPILWMYAKPGDADINATANALGRRW